MTITGVNLRTFHGKMLAACVVIFAAQILVAPKPDFIAIGALYGPDVVAGQWWRIFSAGFLHASITHLGLNMLSLYILGRPLEMLVDRAGRWAFPTLYLGSLVGGSLGAMILEYDVPSVGASGAIFGLLGAAIVIPQRLGMGWNGFGVAPWLAVNLVFTFIQPNISRGGHLGGLVAGLGIGAVLASLLRNRGDHPTL